MMGSRLRHFIQQFPAWIERIPFTSAQQRRQAVLLQWMLLILFGSSLISLPVNLLLDTVLPALILLAGSQIVVIVMSLAALLVVRQGHLARAALIASFALIVGLFSVIVVTGINHSIVAVFALALPLTITSLLATRRDLALVTIGCAFTMIGAALLESASPQITQLLPTNELPLSFVVLTFLVILGVLALLLHMFGTTLRDTVDELTDANVRLQQELTERKRLETELLRAQRLESVGLLASGIAHDFNNLLTSMTAYTQFAYDSLEPADPARHDLREALRATGRAATLTRQLLAFARRQVLEPQLYDAGLLVRDVGSLLRPIISENIELYIHADPNIWPVNVDPGQIEQVLMNLAVNARDAMPKGGKLTINAQNMTLTPWEASRFPNTSAGEYVAITVEDTGIGMTEAVREHAFEPFFTTKATGHGTGLGLATSYGIITQHGGHISLTSEPGSGTSFTILLPRASHGAVTAPAPATTHPLPHGNEVILVVEDEELVRTPVVRLLRQLGYIVYDARNGSDALHVFHTLAGGRVDLVVTDVVMPQISGEALVQQLRAQDSRLRVLYTTGYTDSKTLRSSDLGEGAALLQKPFTPDTLARKVREILNN